MIVVFWILNVMFLVLFFGMLFGFVWEMYIFFKKFFWKDCYLKGFFVEVILFLWSFESLYWSCIICIEGFVDLIVWD